MGAAHSGSSVDVVSDPGGPDPYLPVPRLRASSTEGRMPNGGLLMGAPDRMKRMMRGSLLLICPLLACTDDIAELPPGYRTVFVLHDIEGFEHEEVADMLGVSVGTSKSQLHKARMRLREFLNKKI